ncbi:hypothetical protein DSO57_1023692 [Entomophthora muscae]|uniref:Uncharacterized protein n=2 Tax=Entomophthora muscae TaxID=34485 RepID=A0ACC2U1I3_9FUNG|nr:hypothetical protein DSO57_1023692 [Entomophthora muscae]
MRVCRLVVKLFLLVSCAVSEECGDGSDVLFKRLEEDCEKLNGNLILQYSHERDCLESFKLKEITGELTICSGISSPLKTNRLVVFACPEYESEDFSQIAAEKVDLEWHEDKDVTFNLEPSVFILRAPSPKNVFGIKGTRLKHVELHSVAETEIRFYNVASLDYLLCVDYCPLSIFPDLKYVKHMKVLNLKDDFNMGLSKAGKIEIQGMSASQSVHFINLETVEEYIQVNSELKLFSAPRLAWGRLVFLEEVKSLDLNESLGWNGTAVFNFKKACDMYFMRFANLGLAFNLKYPCKHDCSRLSTPLKFKYQKFCDKFGTIEINQHSPKSYTLDEATTLIGDLIITNYNSFSAPKLHSLTGNITIINSNAFHSLLTEIIGNLNILNSNSFSAPNLKIITGNLINTNSTNFSAPNLTTIQGSLTTRNSSSLNVPNLKEITGNLTIFDSNSFSAPNLKTIQTNLIIANSSSFSASSLEVSGSVSIESSNDFSLSSLNEINGNLKVTNSTCSSAQALFHLNKATNIHFQHQTNNLEFKSLKYIDTLRISQSSLKRITGITATSMEDLVIKDCSQLSNIPFSNLEIINNVYLAKLGVEDLTHIFPLSFTATNSVTITNFTHDRIYLHLLNAGKLILKDNTNLETFHLKAEHLNTPLKSINNPGLRAVIFKDMKITYKLQNNIFKVFAASTLKEIHKQGDRNTVDIRHPDTDVTPERSYRSTKGVDPKANILKAYIIFVLPSAALATIGIILYLQ